MRKVALLFLLFAFFLNGCDFFTPSTDVKTGLYTITLNDGTEEYAYVWPDAKGIVQMMFSPVPGVLYGEPLRGSDFLVENNFQGIPNCKGAGWHYEGSFTSPTELSGYKTLTYSCQLYRTYPFNGVWIRDLTHIEPQPQ